MQQKQKVERQIRNLLEQHLLEWNQEGYAAGWFSLKQEMPGYTDLQPLVDSICRLIDEESEREGREIFKTYLDEAQEKEGV